MESNNNIRKIRLEDLLILGFYPYRSWVGDILCEYSEFENSQIGDNFSKELYKNIEEQLNYMGINGYMGNKTAYKVQHIPSGTVLYVGHYDYNYVIGLSCNNENNEYYEIIKKKE